MKNRVRKNIFLFLVGVFFIRGVCVMIEAQSQILRRAYDNYVLDNRDHYLTCKDLPTKTEVERIVEQHRDVIQQIEQVAPGLVGIEIDSPNCEGRADLLIWYGSHQQRVEVEKIIGGDTFFEVPYRLQNR
jgi:hypothetical protein